MAPLSRSFSLPVSLSNHISRLKALSGAADKDEVSSRKDSKSPQTTPLSNSSLAPIPEGQVAQSASRRPSLSFSVSNESDGSSTINQTPKTSPATPSTKLWSRSSIISLPSRFSKKSKQVDVSNEEGSNGLGLERMTSGSSDEGARGRSRRSKAIRTKTDPPKDETLTQTIIPPSPPSNTFPPTTIPAPLNDQAHNLLLGAIDRGRPTPSPPSSTNGSSSDMKRTGSALAALGLRAAALGGAAAAPPAPPKSPDKLPEAPQPVKASFLQPSKPVGSSSAPKQARAPSPFFRARRSRDQARARDKSPEVGALKKDNYAESEPESVGAPKKYRPQASAYEDDSGSDAEVDTGTDRDADGDAETSDGSSAESEDEDDILDEDGEVIFDEETEKNTEANAVFYEGDAAGLGGRAADSMIDEPEDGANDDNRSELDFFGEEVEQDPLGEGPNVIVPPQSLFAASSSFQPRRRKSQKSGLDLVTSRPAFARDRCTITLTHGDPDRALEESGKRMRRYVVLSDLSEESRYAVEWAIGTVARDGDELFLISVKEDEIDPKSWSNSDKAQKLRVQKERQTTALLLVRQVTGLLQRTRLHITVTCQFLHAKNSRHMLLDLIDFLEPTMVIVGSRGYSILLGSTSHYLVQKSSVPVMVARRRLLRPLRKTNPANLRHSPRVSLASASIEKAASSRQEDDVMDVAEEEGTTDDSTIAKSKQAERAQS
ncbi:hypothetical protein CI109_103162 [Kwoniella shandongensis]|uniref:UspA domain-containing protein n=1 Tax=Kwoniella shandongensis TaxID=1734106 RepID=A0AAJ8LHJ0_9TREE